MESEWACVHRSNVMDADHCMCMYHTIPHMSSHVICCDIHQGNWIIWFRQIEERCWHWYNMALEHMWCDIACWHDRCILMDVHVLISYLTDPKDRHVLIIEDLIDTGHTLAWIKVWKRLILLASCHEHICYDMSRLYMCMSCCCYHVMSCHVMCMMLRLSVACDIMWCLPSIPCYIDRRMYDRNVISICDAHVWMLVLGSSSYEKMCLCWNCLSFR